MPRVQAVGNDQPVIGDGPRTVSGKRPTAASLQLQREYLDWSAVPPSRDDVVRDYDAFIKERRQTAVQELAQKRKEARHARGLLRKPAGQGARYGLLRPGPRSGYIPLGEHRGGSEIKPNSKRQLRFAAQRQRAADHVSPKRSGRPIDPNSKRQRDLAARQQEAEAKAETERKLSQMTPAELEAYHREQHDLEVKRATVLRSEERLRSGFQIRLRHLRSVELRKYVPLERREEVLPSPPSSPPLHAQLDHPHLHHAHLHPHLHPRLSGSSRRTPRYQTQQPRLVRLLDTPCRGIYPPCRGTPAQPVRAL